MKITGPSLFPLGLIVSALCCFDTAGAQTNAVIATPQQLTFNTQTGVTTQAQTVLLSSASGDRDLLRQSLFRLRMVDRHFLEHQHPRSSNCFHRLGRAEQRRRYRLYQYYFGNDESAHPGYFEREFHGCTESHFRPIRTH